MASQILERVPIEPVHQEKDCGPAIHKGKMIISDKEAIDFIRALKVYEETGDFIKAMEIVHGHGRFNWFYAFYQKVSKILFHKRQPERSPATRRIFSTKPL